MQKIKWHRLHGSRIRRIRYLGGWSPHHSSVNLAMVSPLRSPTATSPASWKLLVLSLILETSNSEL